MSRQNSEIGWLDFFRKKRKTPKQRVREQIRIIRRAERMIEGDLRKIDVEEHSTHHDMRTQAEQGRVEEAYQKKTHELGERIKELNCLSGISSLREKPGLSIEKTLQNIVD